jgi:hypothetical protein
VPEAGKTFGDGVRAIRRREDDRRLARVEADDYEVGDDAAEILRVFVKLNGVSRFEAAENLRTRKTHVEIEGYKIISAGKTEL